MPKGVKGGPQEGSGRPKGRKNQKTLDLEWERELIRRQILNRIGPVTDAQLDHAAGVMYIALRNPDGTYTRATNTQQVDAALAVGETAFKFFTQAPNPQAYSTLMAYAIDRPKEQKQEVEVSGSIDLVGRLKSARLRLKK